MVWRLDFFCFIWCWKIEWAGLGCTRFKRQFSGSSKHKPSSVQTGILKLDWDTLLGSYGERIGPGLLPG